MTEFNMQSIQFNEQGLVPVVVQHAQTKEVLTVAYMNQESLEKTIATKETWFYSRSRKELWNKGATSGNKQQVISIRTDCDQDALVVEVIPNGPACHTGETTCFHKDVLTPDEKVGSFGILADLVNVIQEREKTMPEGAYTTYLFEKGVDKIGKKIGEEATEVVIAAKNRDAQELQWEAADLLYHLLVLLQEQKVDLYEVLEVLQKRHESK
ncbi:bifunctional phosphoribosyl-AMP cyclohydrolase/phosphoribosyl-ATP diphosphatase HisIE [Paenisporosarcina quisquiliarum]|uniref:bifunctional phosphoribosyl-AMP cyclohydrolase/phosphoribosyl-ATP diphosphatase HisIE n=1 Tax=Paenisporosarcina quisquiliarum TaxID=365346 RepID=UPI00373534C6